MANARKDSHLVIVTLLLSLAGCLFGNAGQAQTNLIRPGEVWPDADGQHIQAHGGGIIKLKHTYYWYGEERRQNLDPQYRYVSCYSSTDLVNWKFRGDVVKMTPPDSLPDIWVLERPKVFYNAKRKQYVMYFHIDVNYKLANVGIAVSSSPTGPFQYVKRFRPLGQESRDIGQFIDDDGTAYLVFEDRKQKSFHIAQLSDDYLDVVKDVANIHAPLEGGAIVHYQGLYYAIGSGLTGWKPNPNKFATAPTLAGPWTEFKDIAPPETNTYGAQSTMLVKVVGTKKTTVLFLGDIWKPNAQWDSRYLWMPLEIGDGQLRLPPPRPFTLSIKTGETTFPAQP